MATILVIDDSSRLRQVVSMTLKGAEAKAWMVESFSPSSLLSPLSKFCAR